jgi:hypothetical protein
MDELADHIDTKEFHLFGDPSHNGNISHHACGKSSFVFDLDDAIQWALKHSDSGCGKQPDDPIKVSEEGSAE